MAWGDADYELADGQWKLSFAKQYNQVKWTLPESIEMSQVNAVTFQVADQKVPISLKVYNGGDDATAANTQYGLSGQTEYTINPSGDGAIDAVGIMITEDKPENATVSLVSVTFELKVGAGDAKLGNNIIKTVILQRLMRWSHGTVQPENRLFQLQQRKKRSQIPVLKHTVYLHVIRKLPPLGIVFRRISRMRLKRGNIQILILGKIVR